MHPGLTGSKHDSLNRVDSTAVLPPAPVLYVYILTVNCICACAACVALQTTAVLPALAQLSGLQHVDLRGNAGMDSYNAATMRSACLSALQHLTFVAIGDMGAS